MRVTGDDDIPEFQVRPIKPLAYANRRVASLREARGNKCEDCGATGTDDKPLEFAHLKPTGLCGRGRGQTQRATDILKNPDSYALLCNKCHRKRDKRGGVSRNGYRSS